MSTNGNDSTKRRNSKEEMDNNTVCLTQSTSNFIDMIQDEMLNEEVEDEEKNFQEKEIKKENIIIQEEKKEKEIEKPKEIAKKEVPYDTFESILNISFETETKELVLENKEEIKKIPEEIQEKNETVQMKPAVDIPKIQKDSMEDLDLDSPQNVPRKNEKDSLEDVDFSQETTEKEFKVPQERTVQEAVDTTQRSDPSLTPLEENEVSITQLQHIDVTQNPILISQPVKKSENDEGLTLSQIEGYQETDNVENFEPQKEELKIVNEKDPETKSEGQENQFFDEDQVQVDDEDVIDSQMEKQLQEIENKRNNPEPELNTTSISEDFFDDPNPNVKETSLLENSQPEDRKEPTKSEEETKKVEKEPEQPVVQKSQIDQDSYDVPAEYLDDSPLAPQEKKNEQFTDNVEKIQEEKVEEQVVKEETVDKNEKQPSENLVPKPQINPDSFDIPSEFLDDSPLAPQEKKQEQFTENDVKLQEEKILQEKVEKDTIQNQEVAYEDVKQPSENLVQKPQINSDSLDIPSEFLECSPLEEKKNEEFPKENLEKVQEIIKPVSVDRKEEKIVEKIELKKEIKLPQVKLETPKPPQEKVVIIEGLDLDDIILPEDKTQHETPITEIKVEKKETKKISPPSQLSSQRPNKRKKENGKFKKLKLQKVEEKVEEPKTPVRKDVKRKLEDELKETNKKEKPSEEITQFETSQKEEVKEFGDTPESQGPIQNLDEYILNYFGLTMYQRGNIYSFEGQIYSMDSEEIDEDIVKITSKCFGSNDNVYEQEIYLNSKHQILKTKCTCPIQKKCKHSCALVISYHESIKKGTPLKDSTMSKLVQTQKKYDQLQNQYHHLLVQYIKTQKSLDRYKNKIKLKKVIDYNLDKEPYYVVFE